MASMTFLDLPGEIRNQIYHHLLTIPTLSTPRLLGDRPLHPNLLTTSRQIYLEAKQILYGCNTFLAHPALLTDMPRLRLYYDTITSAALISHIRCYHIRLRLDNDPNFSAEKARRAFSGVEELTIEVFQAQFGSSDQKALRLFEGVRGVGRARIYGSVVAFREYVEWLQTSMMALEDRKVVNFEQT